MTAFVDYLHCTARALWACRVSLFSLTLGYVLLVYVPQAQDLFLDIHAEGVGRWHWSVFFAFLVVFWVLPLQLAAVVMLAAAEPRLPCAGTRYFARLRAALPVGLGLCAFLLTAYGHGQALGLLEIGEAACSGARGADCTVAAEVRARMWLTLGLGAAWLAIWPMFGTRIRREIGQRGTLGRDRIRRLAIRLFPIARDRRDGPPNMRLGTALVATWAAVALGVIWVASLYFVYSNPLAIQPAIQRAPVLMVLIGGWIPAVAPFAYLSTRTRLPVLGMFAILLAYMSARIPSAHTVRIEPFSGSAEAFAPVRQPTLKAAIRQWRKANGCDEVPNPAQRCAVRPIIVATEGGASRAAFMTAGALGHLEDVSRMTEPGMPAGRRFSTQLFAISAVSGGALGAGVFASLLDEERRHVANGGAWKIHNRETPNGATWFKTITGRGSGATLTWREAGQLMASGDFLTPAVVGLGYDVWVPWFHMLGWGYGNRSTLLEKAFETRFAAMLPTAAPTAVQAQSLLQGRASAQGGLSRGFATLAPTADNWRPLLIFNGTSISTGRRIVTSHLAPFLDVPDGTRPDQAQPPVVFGDTHDFYRMMCARPPKTGTNDTCGCAPASALSLASLERRPTVAGCDVRVSTAVLNAARFPIVSSHGDIYARDGTLVDRVADGGYFDYAGIVTAQELVTQIRLEDSELQPFILMITNDPGTDTNRCGAAVLGDTEFRREPPLGTPVDWKLFAGLRYPLDLLLNARVARSVQASTELRLTRGTIRDDGYGATLSKILQRSTFAAPASDATASSIPPGAALPQFAVIGVEPSCSVAANGAKSVRSVPMSWWLSVPIQARLDRQICGETNTQAFGQVMGLLSVEGGPEPRTTIEALRSSATATAAGARRVDRYCALRGESSARKSAR